MLNPNIDLALLKRVCPEMWDLYQRVRRLRYGKTHTTDHERQINAIAATICDLARENEALQEERDTETDSAYRAGKEDGDRAGYEAGLAARKGDGDETE